MLRCLGTSPQASGDRVPTAPILPGHSSCQHHSGLRLKRRPASASARCNRRCVNRGHCASSKQAQTTLGAVVSVRSVNRLSGWRWQDLAQVTFLLASSFYEDGESWQLDSSQPQAASAAAASPDAKRKGLSASDAAHNSNSSSRTSSTSTSSVSSGNVAITSSRTLSSAALLFGASSLLAILIQHATYGGRHVTLLAESRESGEVIGCCGLTLDAAPSDVVEATGAPEGCEYALLTGLAVAPPQRRRGVASALLKAAEQEAWRGPGTARRRLPALLALLVSKLNVAGRRLYERNGYEEAEAWVDTRWELDAEKGRVGKPRRLLLFRRLLHAAA